jgi:hypothetical protein
MAWVCKRWENPFDPVERIPYDMVETEVDDRFS